MGDRPFQCPQPQEYRKNRMCWEVEQRVIRQFGGHLRELLNLEVFSGLNDQIAAS